MTMISKLLNKIIAQQEINLNLSRVPQSRGSLWRQAAQNQNTFGLVQSGYAKTSRKAFKGYHTRLQI